MKRIVILYIVIFLILGYAQAPDTLWTKTYGGIDDEEGWSVQEISDGGYIIAGHARSFGAGLYDVYLIKTDSSGDTLWTKTFGGTNADYGRSVQQTSDGGYIIAGYSSSFSTGDIDVFLIKTDSLGDTVWTKTFGGTDEDAGFSVQQTSDGGYIIVGRTRSFGAGEHDVYLIKTDSSGDTLWTKTFGGTDNDAGFSVQQITDGGYIICGLTESFGADFFDVYLIKTNSWGDTLWTKIYGGTGNDAGYSVQQTSDGGYIVSGEKYSFGGGDWDVYLIKTGPVGDTLWTKTFGGTDNDVGISVQQIADGGYIICGLTESFGTDLYDVYLIKVNSLGDTVWAETFGGTSLDAGHSVQQTTDGGYIIAGFTMSFGAGTGDVYLIKTEPDQGINEHQTVIVNNRQITATIFYGPLQLPEGRNCKVFDITGRIIGPESTKPGVYFIEVDGVVTQKVVKIR